MTLGMFFMLMMLVVNVGSLIFILNWMRSPNDKYDELLERIADGGEVS